MIALVLNGVLLLVSIAFCFSSIGLYMVIPIMSSLLSIWHFKTNKFTQSDSLQPANALKVSAIMFNIILFLNALALTLSLIDPKKTSPYLSLGFPLFGMIAFKYLVSSYNMFRLFQKNG